MPKLRPSLEVAVVMQHVKTTGPSSRWQPWRWQLADVVLQEDGFGRTPRLLYKNDSEERWLYPGYTVELFKDDVEGYQLNASTEAPGWFVLWRMEDQAGLSDEPLAKPEAVSLSYYDAGRWLDAQETVEQVAAPAPVVAWLQAFVDAHPVLEPKRRKRPESFRTLSDRFGQPASISTEKKSGADHG
ncbi:DUF3305 domain-containing protein [Rhodoferax sp.]|uniref:DUF3305 domain-containing protein n=1 Tax=Rhodoferax sp. TaxID=50421 RepID=UPI00374D194E